MRFTHALIALILVAQVQGASAQVTSSPVPPVSSPTQNDNPGQGQHHHGHFKQMIKQLGLSQEQKSQIKQIMQSQPKGKARRQAILAVLTPEQRQQLQSLMHSQRPSPQT